MLYVILKPRLKGQIIKMAYCNKLVSACSKILYACSCPSLKVLSNAHAPSLRGKALLRYNRRLLPQYSSIRFYYVKPKERKGPSGKTWLVFGGFMACAASGVVAYLGYPEDGTKAETDLYKNEPVVLAYLYRARDRLHEMKETFADPSSDLLLPDPLPEPYIQPPYTLVLEMTDVLVHPEYDRKSGWRFRKRPGVDKFLSQLTAPLFEIVIYTHENGFSAAPLLDGLDPEGFVMYRLFRDATKYLDGCHVKDLARLNRDLTKVILLDCNPSASKLQPRNSLILKKWEGDPTDTTLIDLVPLFHAVATSGVEDVRTVLDFYRDEEDVVAAFKRNQELLQKQQEEQMEALRAKSTSRWGGFFGSGAFGRRS